MAKKAYHHGNLREALVAAGLRAIAEDGATSFSLRDVARRAGVSAAAPYRHFKDKDELFAAIAVESIDRLRATMDAALVDAPTDPLERFRATGIAYVRFAVEHPAHFLALCVPGMSERVPAEYQERYEASQAEEIAQLLGAQADGTIAEMPIDVLLLSARSIMHGLAHLIVQGELGAVTAPRAEELAKAVTLVLGVGLYPRTGQRIKPVTEPRAATPPSSTTDRRSSASRRRAPRGPARRM